MTQVDVLEAHLPLSRPFTIARGTTETLDPLFLRLEANGRVGWGEAHPSPDVTGETRPQTRRALTDLEPEAIDPLSPSSTLDRHEGLPPAARAALDLALHDLAGKNAGQPVHALLDLPPGQLPCAATVTVTDPEDAVQQARAWLKSGFFHLKVKIDDADVGLAVARRVAAELPRDLPDRFPEAELWIDANEALSFDQAHRILPELDEIGVRLVEQPLSRDREDELAELTRSSPVPILLDESVTSAEDVRRLGALEGPSMVNVKVQKVGGLQASVACLDAARATGTPVVVGCNIETGLGIAAGSALAGSVERADLDGNRFLARDPFPLPRPRPGFAGTPEGPGLGAYPDPEHVPARLDPVEPTGR